MSARYALILREYGPGDLSHALMRVWAADVRDRRPPYREASPVAAALAGVLCRILDASNDLHKNGRPHCDLGETRKLLLNRLRALGVQPPRRLP